MRRIFISRVVKHRKSALCKSFSSISPLVEELPASGIRSIMVQAAKIEKDTNIKCIHLQVGQPNFTSPKHILDACVNSLHSNETTYIANAGLEDLRTAIANVYKPICPTTANNIIVTSGAMLSLYTLFITLLSPGDECLIPIPGEL